MKSDVIYEASEDYAQSANTLFHFMKKPNYLKDILIRKAIVPRYCLENVDYLNICNNGHLFREIYVMQKCFCDIPFHQLTATFELRGVGENYEKLSEQEKREYSFNNSHTDFYGEYAIAFSKKWGEKHNLHPIQYLNEASEYTQEFSELIKVVLGEENIPDLYPNDILQRLSFAKPLRGIMSRKIKTKDRELEVEFYKNFHDEQEWRYVPASIELRKVDKEAVIANPKLINWMKQRANVDVNDELVEEGYSNLWLKYNYEDVRYIIVPDATARLEVIDTIRSIGNDNFNDIIDVETQKYVLISKILVLNEIRKDW